jgi:hypothetical protein
MARKSKSKSKADYRGDVDKKLLTLRGQTRKDLEVDDRRDASSPLGMGSGSQPRERGRKR